MQFVDYSQTSDDTIMEEQYLRVPTRSTNNG